MPILRIWDETSQKYQEVSALVGPQGPGRPGRSGWGTGTGWCDWTSGNYPGRHYYYR